MQCKMFSFPLAFCLSWNNSLQETHFWKTSLSLHPPNIIRTKLTVSCCWEFVDTQMRRRCFQSFMKFSNSLELEGHLWNWYSDHPGANIKILVEVYRVMIFLSLSELELLYSHWMVCCIKPNGMQKKEKKYNTTYWIMGSTGGYLLKINLSIAAKSFVLNNSHSLTALGFNNGSEGRAWW